MSFLWQLSTGDRQLYDPWKSLNDKRSMKQNERTHSSSSNKFSFKFSIVKLLRFVVKIVKFELRVLRQQTHQSLMHWRVKALKSLRFNLMTIKASQFHSRFHICSSFMHVHTSISSLSESEVIQLLNPDLIANRSCSTRKRSIRKTLTFD